MGRRGGRLSLRGRGGFRWDRMWDGVTVIRVWMMDMGHMICYEMGPRGFVSWPGVLRRHGRGWKGWEWI